MAIHLLLKSPFWRGICDIAHAILINSTKQSAIVVVVNSRFFMAFFTGFKTVFNSSTSHQNCQS
jgi:hypothetical protein